jgi:hypothetical protein
VTSFGTVQGYVLVIGCDRRVPTAADPTRADTLAASVPKGAWARISAGPGAKGQRYYDWTWVTLTGESRHHWLLIRPPPPPRTELRPLHALQTTL